MDSEDEYKPFAQYRVRNLMKTITKRKVLRKEMIDMMSLACELFVMDVTYKAFEITQKKQKKILSKSDILEVLVDDQMYDFCIDIIHKNLKDITK